MNKTILISVTLAALWVTSCTSAQEIFEQGLTEDRKQNYDSAMALYEDSIARDQSFVKAYNNRAVILYKKGDLDGALKEIDRALAVKPDYASAISNRGLILEARGNRTEAMQLYEKAIASDPNLADAQFNAGNLALKLGQPASAVAHLEKANSLNPGDRDTALLYARALNATGNPMKARAIYTDVREKDPKNRDALLGLIQSAGAMGNTPESIRLTQQFMAENPDCGSCLNMLGSLYAEAKDYDRAIATFSAAAKARPNDPAPRFHLGFLYSLTSRKADAQRSFEEFLKLKGDRKDDQTQKAEQMLKSLKKGEKPPA